MRPVLAFDVNETLLDLSVLAPLFERHLGDASLLKTWFALLIQQAMVASLTGVYRDFGVLAGGALGLMAKRGGLELSQAARDDILGAMRRLPPHPDVAPALSALQAAGFRLCALTNSPYPALEAQLEHAELRPFFERLLSVDEVRAFKPHPAVYRMAAQKLGVDVSDILLVAAHNWDTTGAKRAGCRAAFVERPGTALGELDETPDFVVGDLLELAALLTERFT